jgi:CBS domain-containing protein
MQKHKTGALCVVNEKKRLAGILTERDVILKGLVKGKTWQKIPVGMIMTKNPFFLHKDDLVSVAMHNMHFGGYRNIPLLDRREKVWGLVTDQNVMKYFMDHLPVEIDNILDEPFTGEHIREGA